MLQLYIHQSGSGAQQARQLLHDVPLQVPTVWQSAMLM